MAWQLIYTSAPRSLEAGRSGFGTVARHRAISPLLVSAIERSSQFSRLPGTDAGRVIYCYRIIAVAGGRFHVLSAIRDAGADYTGRTNHIAHHLIVDPREIAQLGPDGPSPADVLLAMRWVTSWNETPRYLEASDEVALSTIHQQTNGSAWEQIAGSASQAWLLATGDASRGAYIIQPGGIDLRAAFGESLRFIPDRLWQISFTTSLQPSDEPADFRWIGIEEQSPLRSRAESSGRPVFNLGRPHELPLVELVQDVGKTPTRQASAPKVSPSPGGLRIDSPGLPPQALGQYHTDTSDDQQEDGRKTSATTKRESARQSPSKHAQLAVIAIAVVAALAFFIIPNFTRERPEITNRRDQVRSYIKLAFPDGDDGLAEKLAKCPVQQLESAEKLAEAAKNTADALRKEYLPEPDTEQVREAAKTARLNVDPPLSSLFQLYDDFFIYQSTLAAIKKGAPSKEDIEQLQTIHSKIKQDNYNLGQISGALHKRFRTQVEELWTARLRGLLSGDSLPNAKAEWFEGQLNILPPEVSKSKDAEDTRIIVTAWKRLDSPAPDQAAVQDIVSHPKRWPKWLVSDAGRKNAQTIYKDQDSESAKPPPLPRSSGTASGNNQNSTNSMPQYFVDGFESLKKLQIEELGKTQTYFLKVGLTDSPRPLIDPVKNGQLNFSLRDNRWYFLVNSGSNTVTFEKNNDKNPPQQPLCFSGRNPEHATSDLFQIWIVSPSSGPLFSVQDKGLSRKGDAIRIDPIVVGFTGVPKGVGLKMELPVSCMPENSSEIRMKPINSWEVDVSSVRLDAEKAIKQKKSQLKKLQDGRPADNGDGVKKFEELYKAFDDEAFRNDGDIKKDEMGKPQDEIHVKFAGLVKAITASAGPDYLTLFNKAADLANLAPKSSRQEEMSKLSPLGSTLTSVVEVLNRQIGDEVKNAKGHPKKLRKLEADRKLFDRLANLKQMFEHVLAATPAIRSMYAQKRMDWDKQVQGLSNDIAQTEQRVAHEQNTVPQGIYRIYIVLNGSECLFAVITIGAKGGK